MISRRTVKLFVCGSAVALFVSPHGGLHAQPDVHAGITVGRDAIGGVVSSEHGAEAGVWVVAETDDLPTKYAKIVVTDDAGRYVIPELPAAGYRLFARGYGLVDSPKSSVRPGAFADLHPSAAPNEAAAAAIYPAQYWLAMLKIPAESEFPGTGANGVVASVKNRAQWLETIKTDGCITCHALGNRATRTIPAALGTFSNSTEAWQRRIQSGQAAGTMAASISRVGPRALALYWRLDRSHRGG